MKAPNRPQRLAGGLAGLLLSAGILAACSSAATETPAVPGLSVAITSPADGASVASTRAPSP